MTDFLLFFLEVAGTVWTRTYNPFGAPVFKTGCFPIRFVPMARRAGIEPAPTTLEEVWTPCPATQEIEM